MTIRYAWPAINSANHGSGVTVFKQNTCYFLTKAWFSSYLAEWSSDRFLGCVQVYVGGTRAFVFLSRAPRRSKLFVRYISLGFNESTEVELDGLTLEFNEFIEANQEQQTADTSADLFEARFEKVLAELANSRWDELRVSALDEARAKSAQVLAAKNNLVQLIHSQRLTYWVDLAHIRETHSANYLASRSANTRSQLRKALRKTEQTLGKCRFEIASTKDQAYVWLAEMGVLHAQRWNPEGEIEGFNNPRFVSFHQKQIDSLWALGQLHMCRLVAGQVTLAYLYNYYVDGRVYFNMSGVNYDVNGVIKPGLLTHWLAIEHYLSIGANTYDFLAGTNQYKESLATHQSAQKSILLRKRRWFFELEQALRNIKVLVNKSRKKKQ